VLVLQGAPVMGCVLGIGTLTTHNAILGAVFILANFLLVAHIWSLNDWADGRADANDENKPSRAFTHKGVSPLAMLALSLGLLIVSLVIFAMLKAETFWIAVCLVLLGFLYSFPGLHLKSVAPFSSLPHLAGGFLHFLLGYSLFTSLDTNALRIAVAFALVFTAGHGIQEVQDHDADRHARLRTNAVVFGKRTVFWAALGTFLFAYGTLWHLSAVGILPLRLGIPALVMAVIHLACARQALKGGLSFQSVRQYRARYRVLFALLGVLVISTLFC